MSAASPDRQRRYIDLRDAEASETSALLRSDSGTVVGSESMAPPPMRKDSWDGYKDFEGMPWRKRPSVYWLIGPYALFTLAFGGVLVPRLNLIIDLICRRYFAERARHDGGFHMLPVVPGADNPQCQIPEVQRNVATFTLAINVVTGALSALTAPRLGAFSDRHGRKRIMILTSCGGLLGEVITILAANYPDLIHYNWLIAAAITDGLAGSFTAGSVVSHSYASDCTPPSRRGVSFGYMHACLFTGMAVGPLLAGYFVEWTGSLLSIFYVTLGCHIVFILYIAFILPESLSPRRQQAARDKHALEKAAELQRVAQEHAAEQEALLHQDTLDPVARAAFKQQLLQQKYSMRAIYVRVKRSSPLRPLMILWPRRRHVFNAQRVRRNLMLLAVIDTVLIAAAMSLGSVTLLYTEFMFHWGNFETSAFMSLVSMVRVVVLMVFFPIMNYFFRTRPAAKAAKAAAQRLHEERRSSSSQGGSSSNDNEHSPAALTPPEANTGADELDVWIIRSAVLSDVLGVTGYIFARTPAVFVLSSVITAFGGLGSATIQSSLTKHVPADRVGELLGAIGLLHSVARVIAPLIFNGLYAATVGTFPQAVFVLVSAVLSSVLLMSLFVKPHIYLTELPAESTETQPLRRQEEAEDILAEDEVVPSM